MNLRYAVIVIAIAAAFNSVFAAQDRPRFVDNMLLYVLDSWIGTWKLNVEKSKFDPGPALKSGTARIQIYGEGIKCALDPVSADGQARHGDWTAQYNGKDYPVAMKPYADSVALNKIDAYTLQAVYKREGMEILSEKWVVSRDRKELTVIQTERNPTGKGYINILVYEKE